MTKLNLRSKLNLLYLGFFAILVFSLCDNGPEVTNPDPTTIVEPNPFTFASDTNKGFHIISWQYFLWLTEKEEGQDKLRFETLHTVNELNPNNPKTDGVILTQSSKSSKSALPTDVNQAFSDGILVDHNGRAVYTSIYMNDIYFDFVMKNKLNTIEGLQNVHDTVNFPVGSFSLKAAWKIVSPEDGDMSNFYTTTAKITKLTTNDDGKVVESDELITEKVALVGFHIGVTVNGHPEMIWSTFEHDQNAPNAPDPMIDDTLVADKDYTFYTKGELAGACNVNATLSLDEATQTLKPITQVFNQYPNGGGNNENQKNIVDLNNSTHASLPDNSVWKNYIEVGAIWFNDVDKLKPNTSYTSKDGLLTGSTRLSNAVIETFTQKDFNFNQCFSCHNTMGVVAIPGSLKTDDKYLLGGKNVLTSHILTKNYLNLVQIDIKK